MTNSKELAPVRLLKRLFAWSAISSKLTSIDCPACGSTNRKCIVPRDRYLLKAELSICADCGLVHTAKNLCDRDLQLFYQQQYRFFYEDAAMVTPSYVRRSNDELKAAYRFLRIQETIGKFDRVLEIGCGLGYFLYECRNNGVSQLYGIELGETFRQYASDALGLGSNVEAKDVASITSLAFQPDLVVAFHVLEHLEKPKEVLRNIVELISSNAWVVFEVPDISGNWEELNLVNFHFAHRSYFSPETLNNLLLDCGLTPIYMSRSETDGIYAGNLRVFARRTQASADRVPTSSAQIEHDIRSKYRPWRIRSGVVGALLRLL